MGSFAFESSTGAGARNIQPAKPAGHLKAILCLIWLPVLLCLAQPLGAQPSGAPAPTQTVRGADDLEVHVILIWQEG